MRSPNAGSAGGSRTWTSSPGRMAKSPSMTTCACKILGRAFDLDGAGGLETRAPHRCQEVHHHWEPPDARKSLAKAPALAGPKASSSDSTTGRGVVERHRSVVPAREQKRRCVAHIRALPLTREAAHRRAHEAVGPGRDRVDDRAVGGVAHQNGAVRLILEAQGEGFERSSARRLEPAYAGKTRGARADQCEGDQGARADEHALRQSPRYSFDCNVAHGPAPYAVARSGSASGPWRCSSTTPRSLTGEPSA